MYVSLHQPVTKPQKPNPNFFALVFVAVAIWKKKIQPDLLSFWIVTTRKVKTTMNFGNWFLVTGWCNETNKLKWPQSRRSTRNKTESNYHEDQDIEDYYPFSVRKQGIDLYIKTQPYISTHTFTANIYIENTMKPTHNV